MNDFNILFYLFVKKSTALRRPSEFRRASVFISRADLSPRTNRQDEEDDMMSASNLQDEAPRSKRSKSILRGSGKKSSSDLKSSRSADTFEETMRDHQNKKDILNYLDNLIESVKWLASFSRSKD